MMRIILICLFLFNYALRQTTTLELMGQTAIRERAILLVAHGLPFVYAAAHTTSGDIIHVAAGTYTETAQIVLGTGISIEGQTAQQLL